MNLNYAIASFITFMICSAVGIFVYQKGRRLLANRLYSFLSFSLAFWAIGFFMHAVVAEPSQCLFWGRFSHIGASFIPIFYLFFILYLVKPKLHRKLLIPIGLIVASIYSILSFHKNFFTSVSPKINLTQWADPGSVYPLFIVYFLGLPIFAYIYLLFNFKNQTPVKKNQLSYVLFASLLGYVGGSSTFLSVYGIKIPFIHPYGLYLLSAYNLIIAYAIVRHQLFDIKVIIKKTLVFAGMFAFSFGVIVATALITQELLPQYFGASRLVSLALSAVIIVFSLRPLENFLINVTNKYLFQKKYDPHKVLKEFADEALTILNLDKLCDVTVDTLANNLYLTNCAVLLLGYEEVGYEIYHSFGIDSKGLYFNAENPLIKHFKKREQLLLYESYDKSLQAQDDVKKEMDKIKSQVCLSLTIRNELVGILSLGAKKSDQPYDADDIDILTTLTKTLSIAISNARLFMQAAQNEKLAAIGTITSAINHEICKPLGSISASMQLFNLDLDGGKYKNHDELLDKVKNVMQDSEKQICRAINITSKLSGFAKPKNLIETKPVDISESIEEALVLLKHKLELAKIKIEKNIPGNLSKIMVDEDQLQQIFFNLLKNAAEAIKENGTIAIVAEEDDKKVKMQVQDTGCGIYEDKLNNIFKPFYTTKGKTNGSGYGLSVVRELIQRNRGNITVKSKVGKGTTFYLEFLKA